MKKYKIKRSIKNKLLFRLLLVVSISILLGIFYTAILSNQDKKAIEECLTTFFSQLDKFNYFKAFTSSIFSNIFYIVSIWLLGISIIGIPIIIIILIIKSFILGFSISSILYFYKLKGIIICFIYIIPLFINLFAIIYLSYYAIIFSKNLNKLLFFKKDINFNHIMKKYFKILTISLLFIIISSILEVYIVPTILNFLQI